MLFQGTILNQHELGDPNSSVKFTFEGEPEAVVKLMNIIEEATVFIFE